MLPTSKVVGIQFGLLSPEQIRKSSVVEITSRDTYVNNKPVSNGLFDVKMGVLEAGYICKTDGHRHVQNPGFHGHIELARPVFYIQHLATVIKVMKCVCFKCSKLLISKTKYKELLRLAPDVRWKTITEQLCKDIKRCGDESDDGCNTLQPEHIRKEGLANLFAEWPAANKSDPPQIVRMTPELVTKIFKRISDEDVHFLGFNPMFSRPEWMICHVLLVPPPSVRPSVRHDSLQRSEDDLTHILIGILKNNKALQDKIRAHAADHVIEDYTTLLQYFVACMIDNQMQGIPPVAQRSGRPLKSIKDRLKGKTGRMRSNLMAKRVDFSARSVITADPNLSIEELGVPLRIAMNMTKPVRVNATNHAFLTQLVRNGPDQYPGAKMLDRVSGETIALKYMHHRDSLVLQEGDVVHRHLMDGDAVLFNRQPTLHRMSMMCHLVRVMRVGDTFRMNVADTKPYNADFDGDEMNMHVPQTPEAEAELRYLAAVPSQIISPANNASIIGIYQDSMLGSYLITQAGRSFSCRDAMRMLAMFARPDIRAWRKQARVSSMDLLTQIMPPLTLQYATKAFQPGDDRATSNAILEIRNGQYLRGQMDKSVLGGRSKGLLQRICNDIGHLAAARFIDDWQNIVTEFMTHHSFSVGIMDLVTNAQTRGEMDAVLAKQKQAVAELMEEVELGLFDNVTHKSNAEELEARVTSLLNQATSEAGKIALARLGPSNRFVQQVQSGSKGSDLNISQMIACLGQQNVDGKRIPYGMDHRTLPYFVKYDDSPVARGFVESSYIDGLKPHELFFHTMAGRVGLIDTAVKTSSTGYIQRRLIKGLEDMKVSYDMTIRTSKGRIVQFAYGDDGLDTTKVEEQRLALLGMDRDALLAQFLLLEEHQATAFDKTAWTRTKQQQETYVARVTALVDTLLRTKTYLIADVFQHRETTSVHAPVAFHHLLNNVQGQCRISTASVTDLTPLELLDLVEEYRAKLHQLHFSAPTLLFDTLLYMHFCPREVLWEKRLNRAAVVYALEHVVLQYKRAIVAPGEMVGMLAGQSLGEVSTQMTLNTFHFAGVASKSNVTRGVPRIEEVLKLTEQIKNPSLSVYLRREDETSQQRVQSILYMLEHTKLQDVVREAEICFDPDDLSTLIPEDEALLRQYHAFERTVQQCGATPAPPGNNNHGHSPAPSKWIMRLEMDAESLLEKNITLDDVYHAIKTQYGEAVHCLYSDYHADKLLFRIRLHETVRKSNSGNTGAMKMAMDQSDHIWMLKQFQDQLLDTVVLRGVKGIVKVTMRKIVDNMVETLPGMYEKREAWVLDTVGTNLLDVLGLDFVDSQRTISNDIMEMYRVLGMEAARQAIYNELTEVVEFDGTYINYHNYSLLVDRMTFSDDLISICRGGINNDDIGPVAKASFEETTEMFLKASRHGELETMRGVSANIMCGQEGYYGTSSFSVLVDEERLRKQSWTPNTSLDPPDAHQAPPPVSASLTKQLFWYEAKDLGQVPDEYDLGF